jgi:nucleotide-binding universal stress UspA family protein
MSSTYAASRHAESCRRSPREVAKIAGNAGGRRDHRIVTGIDGSASSLSALRWAIHLARCTGAAVDVVAVWRCPVCVGGCGRASAGAGHRYAFAEIAEKIVAEAIGDALGAGGEVRARAWVVEGDPAQVLLDASDGADLLVVGSQRDGGLTGAMLGSVSQHCVHHACCPVVVIRGEDHD